MKQPNIATRRGFLLRATSALSAPIALAAIGAPARAATQASGEPRPAALEDERAIRALQLAYAERMNTEAPARLPIDSSGTLAEATVSALVVDARDAVQIAPDRSTATAVLRCELVLETPIEAPGFSLVDLARLQGQGVLRRREPRVLEQIFMCDRGVWRIAKSSVKEIVA